MMLSDAFAADHALIPEAPLVSPAKPVEVTRLSFPLPLVFAIVGTAIAVSGAQYVSQAGLRSDVRDILTRMEMKAQIDASAVKLQDERFEQMRKDVDALTREDRLRQYDLKTMDARIDAIEKGAKK